MGDDADAITLREYGVSMHKTPSGKEGHLYTAEEVYQELLSKAKKKSSGASGIEKESSSSDSNTKDKKQRPGSSSGSYKDNGFDGHDKWKKENSLDKAEIWAKRVSDAAKIAESCSAGSVPVGVKRELEELSKPRLDWKSILAEFVEEEIVDFSFSPPDRRFDDSPFYLPDFNDTVDKVENLLFMIDTSGSVSSTAMTKVYSEVAGALSRFDGRLSGLLGFFDSQVYGPTPFADVESLTEIRPKGGGGTSFHAIFDYVRSNMSEEPPYCIIILTDGYAPFPDESAANGIPVLWVMTTDIKAPFGKNIKLD
jgi:predicted metal-dependent peptidase